MIPEHEDVRLRRYVLGELPDEECAAIEQQFLSQPDALERVNAAEAELIDDYLAGRLPLRERDRFEHALLASPRHRKRLDAARGLKRGDFPMGRTRRWRSIRVAAIAGLPMLMFACGIWMLRPGTRQAAQPPRAAVEPSRSAPRAQPPPAPIKTPAAAQVEPAPPAATEPQSTRSAIAPPPLPVTARPPTPSNEPRPATPRPAPRSAIDRSRPSAAGRPRAVPPSLPPASVPSPARPAMPSRAAAAPPSRAMRPSSRATESPSRAAPSPPRVLPVSLVLSITPLRVHTVDEQAVFTIPPSVDVIILRFEGEAGATPFVQGQVVVRTVAGKEAWRGAAIPDSGGVPPAVAHAEIPADRLPSDDYVAELFETNANGQHVKWHRYLLRISAVKSAAQ